MKNYVSASEILSILDGMEECPRMYGGVDALEGIYYTLLSLLFDHDRVQSIFFMKTNELAGFETSCRMIGYVSSEEELMSVMKSIRHSLMKEIPGKHR